MIRGGVSTCDRFIHVIMFADITADWIGDVSEIRTRRLRCNDIVVQITIVSCVVSLAGVIIARLLQAEKKRLRGL